MKEFITKWKTPLTLSAIGIYALIWYLIYWATSDVTLSIIITAVIVLGDFAVLAYIFRDELKARFGSKTI